MRGSVGRDIRSVFDSPDLPRAEARLAAQLLFCKSVSG
jgi:hypothetical protein